MPISSRTHGIGESLVGLATFTAFFGPNKDPGLVWVNHQISERSCVIPTKTILNQFSCQSFFHERNTPGKPLRQSPVAAAIFGGFDRVWLINRNRLTPALLWTVGNDTRRPIRNHWLDG